MEQPESFTTTLVRLLQSGAFQQFLDCREDQCAKVEFRLQQHYHVHLARRHIVVKEQDVETIRRHVNGKWQWARPTVCQARRIVLDRRTGQILEAPTWGRLTTKRGERLRRQPQPPHRAEKVLDTVGLSVV